MKSKLIKTAALLLTAVFALSACAGAESYFQMPPALGGEDGGIHIYNMSESGTNIVENGQTDYRILLPADPQPDEQFAAEELQLFFQEATGVRLAIVEENSGLNGDKYFSIGATELRKAVFTPDKAVLGSQGFNIRTKDNTVYLAGVTATGTLFSVYEYLHLTLSYEYFGDKTYSIKTGIKNLPLHNFDVTDVPDILHRVTGYGGVMQDIMELKRLRQVDYSSMVLPLGGRIWHNSLDVLPKAVYQKDHPKWYSKDGTQLSYTAQGDEAELELMHEEVLEVSKKYLKQYPDLNIMTMSIQDEYTFCDSAASVAEKQKYGTNSAVVIKFLNRMKANIDEWFETEEGTPYSRELQLLFFAYYATVDAPVKLNESTGKYEAIDESVICAPGVYPFYAAIEADYNRSMYDTANSQFMRNLEGWAAISDKVFLWTYETNFNYFLTPFNSFNSLESVYKAAKKSDAEYLFNQAQHVQSGNPTGWSALKIYLNAKLGWNVNHSIPKLTETFFKGFYGPAAEIMLQLFEEYRVLGTMQVETIGYGGTNSIWMPALNEKYWPKGHLLAWIDDLESAENALSEIKKSHPQKYERFYRHVAGERVAYLYLLITMYAPTITDAELLQYKLQAKEDMITTGISRESSKNPLSTLYENWNI